MARGTSVAYNTCLPPGRLVAQEAELACMCLVPLIVKWQEKTLSQSWLGGLEDATSW